MTMPAGQPPRAMRECDICHVVDDLGHHQVAEAGEGGLEVRSIHFACCAQAGCPDGSCHAILTGAPPGV